MFFDNRWVGGNGIGKFSSELLKRVGRFEPFNLSVKPTSPFDCFYLTRFFLEHPKEMVFSPGYNSPLLCLNRYVFTVHDLNHIDLPYNSSFLKRVYYRFVLKNACRKAFRVLTVSDFSKQRIIEWSGVDATKVVNVGNGVDEMFSTSVEKHRPGYPYLLCVSNRKLHKNENRLLSAFAKADIPQDIKLVFSGTANEDMSRLITSLGLENRVVFTGYLEDNALPSLYRGALGLAFPSLYEGFGLPVIEAMACGIPVLTSNVTSLPEVAADAAILVEPLDIDAIAFGLESLVNDDSLREELVQKGLLRAKDFSWEKVAERVSNVIKGL